MIQRIDAITEYTPGHLTISTWHTPDDTNGWAHQTGLYWSSYPVFVCTDKTAKAINIVKLLQANKHIDIKSVPKFIELVEQLAGLL